MRTYISRHTALRHERRLHIFLPAVAPVLRARTNHFLLHDIDLYRVSNRERASNARYCRHTGRLVRRAIQARLCGAASAREVPAHYALLYCASMARQQGVAAIISEQLWAVRIARQPLPTPEIYCSTSGSTSGQSVLHFPDFSRAANRRSYQIP